jgi:hypothetical protein
MLRCLHFEQLDNKNESAGLTPNNLKSRLFIRCVKKRRGNYLPLTVCTYTLVVCVKMCGDCIHWCGY